jgi:hypothetical protein
MTAHRPTSTDPQILAGRLATGWVMIDQEPHPNRAARLEDFWLALLHEYKRVVDAECDRGRPAREAA